MHETHLNFVYKLEGDVREVDVFSLAPTLLALGELIQIGNQEVNPDGRQIGINVKPFREGSFIVDLTVFPQTQFQQLLDLLSTQPAERIKNVLEWLGLVTGTGGIYGVVQLVKWLRGKPKAVDEVKPGEFRYTANDDRSITVNAPVHQLLSNSAITNNIYKVYVTPLENQPFVDDVKTYLSDDEGSAVQINREDAHYIKEFAGAALTEPAETVKESVHEGVFLNPKRGSFDGDPRDWSFYRGDGEIITATIKDKEFLQACEEGNYRLNASDLLTVDLLERQTVIGTRVKKPVYEILKVKSYIKAGQAAEST